MHKETDTEQTLIVLSLGKNNKFTQLKMIINNFNLKMGTKIILKYNGCNENVINVIQ